MVELPPSPVDMGMPEKFDSWRTSQPVAIECAVDCPKKYNIQCMPTGTGKSLTYIAASIFTEGRTVIVTASKGLQDQLMADFAPVGLVDIRGKGNYQCVSRPDWTCEDGHNAACMVRGTMTCGYRKALIRALSSNLVLTNYAFLISQNKYGDGLGHIDNLVCDEGHEIVDEIARAAEVVISHREVEDILCVNWPMMKTDLWAWREWARAAKIISYNAMLKAKSYLGPGCKAAHIREYRHLWSLTRKLVALSFCTPSGWVVDETEIGFRFDPVNLAPFSRYLFNGAGRVHVYSATASERALRMVGVPREDISFEEYDSPFDPSRCPVIYVPTVRVDNKMTAVDMSTWMMRADQLIGRRLDRRGIFHTVSYSRQKYVADNSRFSQHMLTNLRGENMPMVLQIFREFRPPIVLVSPSVSTGYNFPYEDSEYQIIGKVPFPHALDKIVKIRTQIDPDYAMYLTMQQFEQMAGRVMRDEDDLGETIVIDDHITWFWKYYSRLASRSLRRLFRTSATVPEPPPKFN